MTDPLTPDARKRLLPHRPRGRAVSVHLVSMPLCDDCLDGAGGECHSPGCALWMCAAPDVSIRSVVAVVGRANFDLLAAQARIGRLSVAWQQAPNARAMRRARVEWEHAVRRLTQPDRDEWERLLAALAKLDGADDEAAS